MSLISVIVPVYKVERYVERCIDSILNQTLTDFELILVDDGSPDNSGTICDEYLKRDKRIKVIHQKNGGLSAARNSGIKWVVNHSNSEWISFIDSDDWVHPQYLELLLRMVLELDVCIGVCGFERTSTQGKMVYVDDIAMTKYVPEEYWIKNRVNATVAWGKLYKKELFLKMRYPVGKIHEDEYVTYKLLFSYSYIAVIDYPLYFYYQNTDSITSQEWSIKRLDGVQAFKDQLSFFKDNHYELAKDQAVFNYYEALYYSLICLSKFPEYSKIKKELTGCLRKLIRKEKKTLQVCDLSKVYKIVYPKLNRLNKKRRHIMCLYKEKGVKGIWRKIIKIE